MKRMKKPFALGAALVMLLSLAACGDAEPEKQPEKQSETSAETSSVGTAYPDKELGFQLEAPAEGETVAIMHTDLGDISLRFFPEAAPKAVENFLTLAKNGYYNGITFHRVMKDFMIQGGDPTATGSGGESVWGKDFEDEFDSKLLNLRGALSMANSGVNTNGSQFFINQKTPEGTAAELKKMYDYDALRGYFESNYEQMKQYYGDSFTAYYPTVDSFIEVNGGLNPYSPYVPDEAWELYAKQGGNINLDGAYRKTGGHTVFGQVYDGMEVVDAIADVSVDETNNKPIADVCIKSIDVTTYAAE